MKRRGDSSERDDAGRRRFALTWRRRSSATHSLSCSMNHYWEPFRISQPDPPILILASLFPFRRWLPCLTIIRRCYSPVSLLFSSYFSSSFGNILQNCLSKILLIIEHSHNILSNSQHTHKCLGCFHESKSLSDDMLEHARFYLWTENHVWFPRQIYIAPNCTKRYCYRSISPTYFSWYMGRCKIS